VQTEELKILLALESNWTVSLNGTEFLALPSAEISVQESTIRFGRYQRRIQAVEWLRPDVVRLRGRPKFRSKPDVMTFYPGERLPTDVDLLRRRRAFQAELRRALSEYSGSAKIEREILFSDRRYGIGGAYPRFLAGGRAVIAVDPTESSTVINGIMRAALLWAPLVRRRVAVVVPSGRHHTIAARLRHSRRLLERFDWLQWNGIEIGALPLGSEEPETHVQEFSEPAVQSEVSRIISMAPGLLQAVPHIAGRAVSIRLRGIEVARVAEGGTTYSLGEPLGQVVRDLAEARSFRSLHPLARAHEERWLESNVIGQIRNVLPAVDNTHIYPQVPSFVGEDRNIIDLLTITEGGRLVVIEIKASADPDLPFQALDYWIAVERHRKAGDFVKKGYFRGRVLQNQPALLVLVAPLLAYHKTHNRLISALQDEVPLLEIGINQTWKREIKILRRRGPVS
jgi:hypothetical protein